MDKGYAKLFSEIGKTISILAEKVMDKNKQDNDENGLKTAQIMRDDYMQLSDKLLAENFSLASLTKADFAKLLVGAMIVVNNIKDRIAAEQKAIDNYQVQIIPRLQRVVNECEDDAQAQHLADELFTISVE